MRLVGQLDKEVFRKVGSAHMRAWLVTWEATPAPEVVDRIAAIWHRRWSVSRVAQMMEALYALRSCAPSQLAAYARRPSQNPYQAQIRNGERIDCGHNPYLYGRPVDNLMITPDPDTGLEIISWIEPPLYALEPESEGGTRMVQRPCPVACRRRIRGPLSAEEIWDRAGKRYKPGFRPAETVTPRPTTKGTCRSAKKGRK
jgi:hypothetical protein